MRPFDKRPLTENSQRISASAFIRFSYLQIKQGVADNKRKLVDLRREEFVKELIKIIESGSVLNLKQEINGEIEYTDPNKVKMTYTRSNLGKGFVFWFICGVCGRRVRYLYIPPNSQVSACRICHKLAYKRQNDSKSERNLNRLCGL